ncbi:hypothetical protein [Brevundimonas sp.]|uniref:hypothetical protein n=1 Tax=Brevundimonas sp. TaxID=1871086 RepID=UPI002737D80B|nr:hypothetical protein [Brevundimonas sp.]MDP3803203.1 hypothetical protein [Brevundimonas sp.]
MNSPPASSLDPEIVAFIEGAIPSVWALETLLLLRRSPAASWTPETLVYELRASAPLVNDCLQRLQQAGLAMEADGSFRYAPASPRLGALCEGLEAAYRERPVAVVNAIASMRPDPLKGFADSFRLGGWKP